ncbi:MAG: hypothetical protein WCJ72_09735 [Chryseobacterium sp.]
MAVTTSIYTYQGPSSSNPSTSTSYGTTISTGVSTIYFDTGLSADGNHMPITVGYNSKEVYFSLVFTTQVYSISNVIFNAVVTSTNYPYTGIYISAPFTGNYPLNGPDTISKGSRYDDIQDGAYHGFVQTSLNLIHGSGLGSPLPSGFGASNASLFYGFGFGLPWYSQPICMQIQTIYGSTTGSFTASNIFGIGPFWTWSEQ